MDPLTHASLPPISHPIPHSSFAYQHSLTGASDYQEEYQNCSGLATPATEMGEYYVPMNDANTSYNRVQAFPIAPPSYCSGETVGKTPSLRPTSSSSMDSNLQSHDDCERKLYPDVGPFGYAETNVIHPSHSCTFATSSENEVQPLQEQRRGSLHVLKRESSFQSFQDSALLSMDNHVPDSRHLSDETKGNEGPIAFSNPEAKDDYSEEISNVAKFDSSGQDPSSACKMMTGKKVTNVKVSEKRRQQNRAAQRAMRERRKRAAQHQEIHMTTILTENAILREKVNYLSNLLLSHAGHLPWSSIPQQENPPPMLPPLNMANLTMRSTGPASSPSNATSPFSFPNHPMFPTGSLAGTATFPSTQSSMLSYYPAGPLELEYLQQGHHVAGLRNISCPSSASNLSRPSTADETSIDHRTSVFGRWQNPSHEGVNPQAESPIAGRMSNFALTGSISTDSCSINTASTISSPTHTDGHLVDTMAVNL